MGRHGQLLTLAGLGLALVGLVGCSGEPEPPPVLTSTPGPRSGPGRAEIDVNDVKLEGGRTPLHPTAYDLEHLDWPAVATLTPAQGAELMEALNQLTAPCPPCWESGQSYATCLRERPAGCEGVLGQLLDRGVRLATAGASTPAIRTALDYDDTWVDVPWDRLGAQATGWGPDTAAVRVVLVVDLQSPFCARVSDAWDALLTTAGDDLAVRVLYWSEERHERSRPAALAAEAAAAQGQQWPYSRLLLSRYHHLEDTDLLAAATQLGLDLEAFERVRADPATAARVDAQRDLAVSMGVRSAPAVFVDGFRQRGARPAPQLTSLLARAVADGAAQP